MHRNFNHAEEFSSGFRHNFWIMLDVDSFFSMNTALTKKKEDANPVIAGYQSIIIKLIKV